MIYTTVSEESVKMVMSLMTAPGMLLFYSASTYTRTRKPPYIHCIATDTELGHHGRDAKFNESFKCIVLCIGSPGNSLELESTWVGRLHTSEPKGLNRVDPSALRTRIPT